MGEDSTLQNAERFFFDFISFRSSKELDLSGPDFHLCPPFSYLINGAECLFVDGLLLLDLGGNLHFQCVSFVGDAGIIGGQFEGFIEVQQCPVLVVQPYLSLATAEICFGLVGVLGILGGSVDGEARPFLCIVIPTGFQGEKGVVIVQCETEGFQFGLEICRILFVGVGPFVKISQCLAVLMRREENIIS